MLTSQRSHVHGACVRRPISGLIAVAAAIVTTACSPAVPPGPERIILVVADTLRSDHVGAYGAKQPTPHMDALAAAGQLFPHSVSAFHMTPMSMGSMFTGVVPSLETGTDNRSLKWSTQTLCGLARFRRTDDDACVPDHMDTLAEGMRDAGYWTIGATANPLLFDPNGYSQGFEDWLEVGIAPDDKSRTKSERRHAESRTGRALHDALFARLHDRPSDRFFLFLQYLDVHDWHLFKTPYARSVLTFDDYLGELVAYLKNEGIYEGSVIVLTSDHGEMLREKHPIQARGGHLGNPSYQSVLRVPLIVHPAVFEQTDRLVRGDDLREMLLSLANASPVAPVAPGGDGPREHFVSEAAYQTYTLGRYKSIWPRGSDRPVLLDLRDDPGETKNVAADHPAVLEAHRARIDELVAALSRADAPAPQPLDADALERLRVLGYLETVEDSVAPAGGPESGHEVVNPPE